MFLSDLEDLEDITNTIVFEDEPSIFTEEYAIDLVETALQLMDEYIYHNPHVVSEPDFHDILLEEIKDIFYIQIEDYIENEKLINSDDIEDDMNGLLEDAFQIFVTVFYPDKSLDSKDYDIEYHHTEEEIDIIGEKIQRLRDIPQPDQRTPEWYNFRWNLITASNAWKALESQSTINQLIYEKCQPLKSTSTLEEEEVKMVNTNTPLHWGQKYEPITVQIYERDYKTTVEDFGCIQHHTYKFLGASPDGIIVNKESDRYGRMLEIKNVVSREINGIPKKEYWIQMQLQMEVCDLDECDFLETKFTEYSDETAFLKDTKITANIIGDVERDAIGDDIILTLSADNKTKGIILYFHTKEGKPFYRYKPLEFNCEKDIKCWEETELEKYESAPYNYTFLKFIYWKLETISCVLVLRNKIWFQNNIHQLAKVWKTIEEERISGYEHRAPVKKAKKEGLKPFIEKEQGCFLKFTNIIKVDTTNI
jgi:putative phage-type endonuclease